MKSKLNIGDVIHIKKLNHREINIDAVIVSQELNDNCYRVYLSREDKNKLNQEQWISDFLINLNDSEYEIISKSHYL